MTARRRPRRALALVATVGALALAACDPPRLGTTAQQLVYTSPATYDFGTVALGSAAAPRTVVVGVSGLMSESHTITAISEDCGDFGLDLSAIALPADIWRVCESCTTCAWAPVCEFETQRFAVTFTPTVAGPQSCTITVQLDDGVEDVVVSGTGVAPDYDLVLLTPVARSLAFGEVVVGQTSAALPITVRNDGTMALEVSAAGLVDGDVDQFTVTDAGPGTLAPGASHTVWVACAPTVAGDLTATFQIVSNDPGDSPLDIALSCAGVQSDLAITPSPARLADTFVGQSTGLDVTLHNNGGAALTVEDLTVWPAQFTVSALGDPVIAPGADAVVAVTFTPDAAVVDSDVAGTLTVTYDGGQTRAVELLGPARSAILSVTPGGEVDFGTVCTGQSERRLFAAINLGTGAFDLTGAAVAGPGFALTLEPPAYPAPLPARGGATVAFELSAAPPLGDVTGELALTTSVPELAAASVTLLASGQPDGVAAAPAAVDFEPVAVAETSGGRAVRLNNCTPGPLGVASATLTGRDAAEFSAVSDQVLPGTIGAFGHATWLVELRPTSAGAKEASLELVHDGGTISVPLTGEGLAEVAGDERGSYYACDAGGAGAGAAWLLAALAFVRRRRHTS